MKKFIVLSMLLLASTATAEAASDAPIVEWSISIGSIITGCIVLLGFIISSVVNAIYGGRYAGLIEARLNSLDDRMERIESSDTRITDLLVTLGEQKVRLDGLGNRIDDVQKYGSHRLAEIIDGVRGQMSADFKDRTRELQEQINRLGEVMNKP